MDGWIKLHRELLDHWIYKDSEYLKVWIEMLIRARYWDEPSKELIGDQLVKVERGEFIFGRPKWSSRLGISEQRLKTLITKMIKEDMIEPIQKFPRFTLYRIKNYEKFNQQDNQQTNQHINQQETHIQQGFDLSTNQHINQQDNQQSNQRSTSSQPAPNQQPTNNKERSKKDNNDKKEIKDIFTLWNSLEIIKHREMTQKMSSAINARLEKITPEEMQEAMQNYKTIISSDLYWYTHKFTLEKFVSPKNLDQFMSENKPFETFRKQGGGGNGKYQRKSNGPTQESRSNASRNEDLYIGSTIGEDEPISEELLQRIRG